MRWLQSILSFPCLDSLSTTGGINRHFRPVAFHNDFCGVDVPGCTPRHPSLLHTPKQNESRGLAPRQNELKIVNFFQMLHPSAWSHLFKDEWLFVFTPAPQGNSRTRQFLFVSPPQTLNLQMRTNIQIITFKRRRASYQCQKKNRSQKLIKMLMITSLPNALVRDKVSFW